MRSTTYFTFAALLANLLALPVSGALASDTDTSAAVANESISTTVVVAMDSAPVNDMDLSESRGAFTPGEDPITNLNNSYLNGSSSGNTVNGGYTGNNQISGGSFTNTQGLVNVIQNSGNNVVIQSSTIVNMTMITK